MPLPSDLPKIELHCHIEGAAPPALVRRLAGRHGIDVSGLFTKDGGYAWTDFSSFLAAYDRAAQVFRSAEDFADLAETYLFASAAEGVIYTEVFISPDHARRSGIPYADYLGGLAEGMARAEAGHGIIGRIIPLIERHFGPEAAHEAVRTALAHLHPRVVGFGMAGDERMFAVADFARAFALAHEAGLPLTCHAGEVCGAASVAEVIDALPVRRIGHGVRAIEDAALVRRLAEEGIVLEVCPGSNVALGVYPRLADHPLIRLRDAGVKVTLSSDDPPFFGTSIGREYAAIAETFALPPGEMLAFTQTALDAAFCDTATRARLQTRLEGWRPPAAG
ncbi:adenosine deaminase [Methylobrevis pamukkalensis]|uniref:Adenine deaminase n=1 Tax=Methylobrevis pamukkalensis TaxID=1439726 RepID=A0A1E3H3L9_9HYPH|nr:adenosine deaminase [Methylobrevis pamukkalensis]ODN70919.1 Adenine deaminase [Methylobrevis pamukkalensis]